MTRSKGLSLAEVVIAIGVASLAVLTLAVFVSTIYRATHEGKSQAAASTVGRRAIERLRSDRAYFRTVRTATEGSFEEEQLYWQAGEVVPMRYHVTTRLEPVAGAPTGYYDASVMVWWIEEHRRREVVLETWLTQP